ncbi:MAG TPA: hypothetical protein VGV65_00790 [Nocardioides sp.]|nr:hypothetical protein [Nocardioides sp.]
MTHVRTITRTITRTSRSAGRIRPHVLRRDGVLQAPSEVPHRSRYDMALAAGWRPTA